VRRLVPFLLCLLIFWSCAPIAVQWDYDPDADFSQYKTFSWMPKPPDQSTNDPASLSPFMEKRLKKAVLEKLTAQGYHKIDATPDLLIAFHLNVRNKKDVHEYGYGYGYSYGRRGYPGSVDVRHYKEGTLTVDLFDTHTKELVWRGWSVSPVQPLDDPRREQLHINQAVEEILKHFPPY